MFNIPWAATHVHVKTGGLYQVLMTSKCSETGVLQVVYRSSPTNPDMNNRGKVWNRPAEMFYDGRFQPLYDKNDDFYMTTKREVQAIFVVSTLLTGRSVSRSSKTPLVTSLSMLRDIKGLGPAIIFPLDLLNKESSLSPVFELNDLIMMVGDAVDQVFEDQRRMLRLLVKLPPEKLELNITLANPGVELDSNATAALKTGG